jgi:GNAT superfamily N-acetyltransferase
MVVDDSYRLALQAGSVRTLVTLLSGAAPTSRLWQNNGVIASVVPSAPRTALCNLVVGLADPTPTDLASIADEYAGAGVSAWWTWVHDDDDRTLAALHLTGYRPGASQCAMVLNLDELNAPDLADLDYDDTGDLATLGAVNSRSQPSGEGLADALTQRPPGLDLRVYQARDAGRVVCALATVDHAGPGDGGATRGPDCGIYWVATDETSRRKGFASRLLGAALRDARKRGCVTSTLQASPMGTPIYGRLGYETLFTFETYEMDVLDQPGANQAGR